MAEQHVTERLSPNATGESALERETIRKVSFRLLPFLFVLYVFNFVDRSNVALAALQMNRDLHFSASAFGFGAGIFFIGYALFEVPSNLLLARVGARRWIARIMISWGILAASMMLVRTPIQFYVVRFLLGLAEAGFFPGVVFYLSQWFPTERRARATSRFFIALPMSGIFGGFFGGYLLGLDNVRGLHGWQWLFLLEGIPSILIGLTVIWYLTDKPEQATWLRDDEREWLVEKMKADRLRCGGAHRMTALDAMKLPIVWILAAPYFLMLTAAYGYTYWAPTVIRDTLHISSSATGFVTAGIACTSMMFMLLHAASSDRHHERFYHAALGGILIAVGFTGATLLTQPVLKVAFLGMVIIGSNAMLSPFWCLPASILGGEAAAVGIALINSLGNIGGFIGPYAIGFFKDKTGGTTGAFLVLAGFGLGTAILCIALKYTTLSRGPTVPAPNVAIATAQNPA
jgi:ACS family tartrate transporter-like MFS transporter